MTRFGTIAALLAASALGGTAALAQTGMQNTPPATPQTPPPPPQQATPPAADSSTDTTATAPGAAAGSYTDADVDKFAGAALAVQKIQQDASVADADKQTKMASAVTASGLSPEKFNAMATASQSDPALMKRIQTAAATKMQASGAAGATGAAGGTGTTGSAGATTGATGSADTGSTGQ